MSAPTKDTPEPIACEDHTATYATAYSYIESEKCCPQKKDVELEFSQSLDKTHIVIYKGAEKECDDGSVAFWEGTLPRGRPNLWGMGPQGATHPQYNFSENVKPSFSSLNAQPQMKNEPTGQR